MDIALLSQSVMPRTKRYTEALSALGHRVHVVSLTPEPVEGAASFLCPVERVDPRGRLRGKARYLAAAPKVRKHLRAIGPDVVFAGGLISNGLLAVLADVGPVVVSGRGDDVIVAPGEPLRGRIFRYVIKRADRVHTVGDELTRIVMRHGVPEDKTFTLTQGLDTEVFRAQPRQTPTTPVRLICTRFLLAGYGNETVLDSLALLDHDASWTCDFAARGDQLQPMRDRAEMLRITDHVSFRGGYERDDIPQMLSDHDIYVTAKTRDGTSISLLEAMAIGCFPVVADVPYNTDWITHGHNGLLFRPGDTRHLARQLRRAIEDTELRATAAVRNREIVTERGDATRNAEALVAWFRTLKA